MPEDSDLLRSRPGAVWLPRDFVSVAGPDALKFLQGQLSQDVDLAVGASAWALLLAPQGKVVALVRVLREGEDAFVLDTDAGWSAAVTERLLRFKLRVRCELEPRSWRCLAIRGEGASAAGGAATHHLDASWSAMSGVDLVGDDPQPPSGTELCPFELYEAVRIEAGVPVMGRELTEATIPAEAEGVVERAVSFTKGCYTGQELVARIDSRGGNVPRRLRGVVIPGAAGGPGPAAGATVRVGGENVGSITSAAWSARLGATVALAYVRRAVEPPAAATVSGEGFEADARIDLLPMVP